MTSQPRTLALNSSVPAFYCFVAALLVAACTSAPDAGGAAPDAGGAATEAPAAQEAPTSRPAPIATA